MEGARLVASRTTDRVRGRLRHVGGPDGCIEQHAGSLDRGTPAPTGPRPDAVRTSAVLGPTDVEHDGSVITTTALVTALRERPVKVALPTTETASSGWPSMTSPRAPATRGYPHATPTDTPGCAAAPGCWSVWT